MIIRRPEIIDSLQASLRQNPVTALLGPRQCGKTTIARLANPLRALEKLEGMIVIDEIQRQPGLQNS